MTLLVNDPLENAGTGSVISINTPDLPEEEIKGMRPARLGVVNYDEWFDVLEESEDAVTYRYTGVPVYGTDEEGITDTTLIQQGFATISVIKYDLNDYEGLEKIKEWEIDLK